MSILKYLKPKEKEILLSVEKTRDDCNLRELCNEQLREVYDGTPSRKRGKYTILSLEIRAKVGKYAAENGTPKALDYFKNLDLKRTTVRNLKDSYLKEKSKKRKLFESDDVAELPRAKRGKRLLLGDIDIKVQNLVTEVRNRGGVINSRIVMALAKGAVLAEDRTLLYENGGHIQLTRDWAFSMLKRLNMVKRRGNTTAKPVIADFDAVKKKFLDDIKGLVIQHNIPPQLIINWDHTGVHLVPVSKWTMAAKGSDKVEIVGLDDKREITGVMAGSLSGDILPPQVIYAGKTDLCHPKYKFPTDWHITHTPNHWANTETSFQYLQHIVRPYVKDVIDDLDLPLGQKSLMLLDYFSAQLGVEFRDKMKSMNMVYVYVPPNCTSKLQPMDLSVQKTVKEQLRNSFETHFAETVAEQIAADQPVKLDLAMSVLKPLSAKWLVSAIDYLKSHPDIVFNGFKESGIAEVLGYENRKDCFK